MHSPLATSHHRVIGCYRAIALRRIGESVLVTIETNRDAVTVSLSMGEAILMADALERDSYLRYALGEGRAIEVESFPETGIPTMPTCGMTHEHVSITIRNFGTSAAIVQLCASARDHLVMALREVTQ